MGKHEVGTPKYIANKIKAKGLQKLRWYCQMCQKQCRDENGFKCHTMSESHHRQLLLFAENAHKYMDEFSREFSKGYLNLLKRQFGTKRVPANRVYQEYIADRGHIHMNATQWLTLTAFVKWLGRTGQCLVDETEKGWYITYIDRDPQTLAMQEKKAKKEKMDKDDEEREMDFIEKQIERAKQVAKKDEDEICKTPLLRPEKDTPLVLDIKLKPKPKLLPVIKQEEIKNEKDNGSSKLFHEKAEKSKRFNSNNETASAKKLKIDSSPVSQGWLKKGLMVKIITKSLGEKYYKAKGIVQSVGEDSFVGKVKLTTPEEVSGHVIRLDQEYLETVIPAIGKDVLILWGKHKGNIAIVKKLHIERYSIDVELQKDKRIVEMLPYEQVCKFVD
ncbi:DNA/RNA-binding protein KIN17 [Pseudomyrmex gracilis]|uniref:DNA/RNA-binding protein KIN17 n=1 Tax=Pseudomyrmex gracilis TaxID=219809 RepID=UPI00099538F1|nr:DNA/RNA-binding protein KIN17 [Pseudomyrmex gracilis]XP_020294239.1 DNA/RNA-binding protein KIN17 [Pseudomyrmex gracilis]